MVISSVQNERVKHVVALQQKSAERRRAGLFVVEGRRELQHCLEAGLQMDSVFWCPELLAEQPVCPVTPFEVTRQVYEKMAYRGSTEGLLAVVRSRQLTLSDLPLPQGGLASECDNNQANETPLIVVLESVEKPGNLGAILRSADASGATAVIVCDPLTDLYNPNLIRSSVGAFFSVPCVACSSEECIDFLKQHNVQILTAQLQDSSLYYDVDMRRATAIVMGTESTGLTQQWREAADAHIRIPMLGRIDSLNVSVSAAILLFEAVRQRRS